MEALDIQRKHCSDIVKILEDAINICEDPKVEVFYRAMLMDYKNDNFDPHCNGGVIYEANLLKPSKGYHALGCLVEIGEKCGRCMTERGITEKISKSQ